MEYRDYLKTPHWTRVRYAMYKIHNEDCEICFNFTSQLNIHHMTYDNINHENYEDLIVICSDCHKEIHENGIKLKRPMDSYHEKMRKFVFDSMVYGNTTYEEAVDNYQRSHIYTSEIKTPKELMKSLFNSNKNNVMYIEG